MRLDDFDYSLPQDAIAQEPPTPRGASRLLVLDRRQDTLQHRTFADLPELLSPGDLLVVNRSRVFPARLLGERPGGGEAEVFLVRERPDGDWDALLRPGKRLRTGTRIRVGGDLEIEVLPHETAAAPASPPEPADPRPSAGTGEPGLRRVRLRPRAGSAEEAIDRLGHLPLPPYIRREDDARDRDRYQTVYAREKGSVAAPTAGLHFTPGLFSRLAEKGIARAELVLHVGPGTFRPVQVDDVRQHRVSAEPFVLPEETAAAIRATRARGGRVVAVGTTTTRVLEHCGPRLPVGAGETRLVIVPPFSFQVTDALVTNFHLPRSSLLLLVSAFAGRERILGAYAEALREGYRFYSYGDAMLVL